MRHSRALWLLRAAGLAAGGLLMWGWVAAVILAWASASGAGWLIRHVEAAASERRDNV